MKSLEGFCLCVGLLALLTSWGCQSNTAHAPDAPVLVAYDPDVLYPDLMYGFKQYVEEEEAWVGFGACEPPDEKKKGKGVSQVHKWILSCKATRPPEGKYDMHRVYVDLKNPAKSKTLQQCAKEHGGPLSKGFRIDSECYSVPFMLPRLASSKRAEAEKLIGDLLGILQSDGGSIGIWQPQQRGLVDGVTEDAHVATMLSTAKAIHKDFKKFLDLLARLIVGSTISCDYIELWALNLEDDQSKSYPIRRYDPQAKHMRWVGRKEKNFEYVPHGIKLVVVLNWEKPLTGTVEATSTDAR